MPGRLAEKCLGKKYLEIFEKLEQLKLIKRVDVGCNKYNYKIHAFRPITTKLRYIEQDREYKEKAIQLYENYLDSFNHDDLTALTIKENLKRTTYKNKPVKTIVHKDNFAGRYYHYLTNIPSRQRLRHIKIDDTPVVELDIQQCQIKILEKVLRERNMAPSFTDWMDDNNVLYDYVKDKMKLPTRSEAKQSVFKMLFGHYNSAASKKMYSLFPDLEAPMKIIKSVRDYNNPSRKIYSNLARILQLEEVNILRTLAFRLSYYDLPFLPVHDSVLVKITDLSMVEKLFTEIIEAALNKPILKIKMANHYKKQGYLIAS